jgi:hypothetical protein
MNGQRLGTSCILLIKVKQVLPTPGWLPGRRWLCMDRLRSTSRLFAAVDILDDAQGLCRQSWARAAADRVDDVGDFDTRDCPSPNSTVRDRS